MHVVTIPINDQFKLADLLQAKKNFTLIVHSLATQKNGNMHVVTIPINDQFKLADLLQAKKNFTLIVHSLAIYFTHVDSQ